MVAVNGDSANLLSIGLHQRLGFTRIGTLPSIGFKHGRWVDSVLMQLPLGGGAMTLPEHEPGPARPNRAVTPARADARTP